MKCLSNIAVLVTAISKVTKAKNYYVLNKLALHLTKTHTVGLFDPLLYKAITTTSGTYYTAFLNRNGVPTVVNLRGESGSKGRHKTELSYI